MRIFKALRGLPVVVLVAAGLLLAVASVVMASGSSSPLKMCVSTKEGAAIKTPKGGACPKNFTLTEVNKEGPEGKQGPEGKEGKEGQQGATGAAGPPAATTTYYVYRGIWHPGEHIYEELAKCGEGEHVISGGYEANGKGEDSYQPEAEIVATNRPEGEAGWFTRAYAPGNSEEVPPLTTYVICATGEGRWGGEA